VLLPLAGAAVIGFVLIEMDRSAKILGAAWIAIGVAYYWVQAVLMKKPVDLRI
jgi:hypothetical protein